MRTIKGNSTFLKGKKLWKGVYSKKEEFVPIFPFSIDPFCEEYWCAGKQTENHKKWWKINQVYSSTFKQQSNVNNSNTNGLFTMANLNSFLSPYEILPLTQENKYLGKFSYFIMKLYVVCTHWNHLIKVILMRTLNIKLLWKSLNYRYSLPDLAPWLTLSGSNYPCLEQFSMVPKMFDWSSTVFTEQCPSYNVP